MRDATPPVLKSLLLTVQKEMGRHTPSLAFAVLLLAVTFAPPSSVVSAAPSSDRPILTKEEISALISQVQPVEIKQCTIHALDIQEIVTATREERILVEQSDIIGSLDIRSSFSSDLTLRGVRFIPEEIESQEAEIALYDVDVLGSIWIEDVTGLTAIRLIDTLVQGGLVLDKISISGPVLIHDVRLGGFRLQVSEVDVAGIFAISDVRTENTSFRLTINIEYLRADEITLTGVYTERIRLVKSFFPFDKYRNWSFYMPDVEAKIINMSCNIYGKTFVSNIRSPSLLRIVKSLFDVRASGHSNIDVKFAELSCEARIERRSDDEHSCMDTKQSHIEEPQIALSDLNSVALSMDDNRYEGLRRAVSVSMRRG